ncbi:MAG: ketopantoate reductase family protein [Clostridiaceae bacterium]
MSINSKIKNICIFGMGGIGGVFGGKIARSIEKNKDTFHKVYFIARGGHLEKIRQDGLKLNLPDSKGLVCIPADAVDDISKVPAPDLLFLCVKGYDLDTALDSIRKNVKEDTIIIPLLNGVDIYERIRKKMDGCIVLPSCVYIGAHIEKHGEVSQDSDNALIISGRDPLNKDYELEELKELFNAMDIKCDFKNDSSVDIWEKYLFIASFGIVTAFSEQPFGGVMGNPELKGYIQSIVNEIISIAEKKGIALSEGTGEKTVNKANNFPGSVKTSYQRDVESRKPKNEGELFGGTIIRLGEETGVDTPVTRKLYEAIQKKLEGNL